MDEERTADSTDDESPESIQFGERIDDGGLSLEDLSESFAAMINAGDDPYDDTPQDAPQDAAASPPIPAASECEDDEVEVSPLSILEAMLFVGHPENRPITSREVAAMMRGVRPEEVDELVLELNSCYDEADTTYHVVSSGAGYLLELRPEFSLIRERFYGKVKAAKLTQAAVDVLAIVAYNQPITKKDVDALRNKSSGALLNQLVRRQLLRIERTDTKPRVTTYHTTDRFLDLFGLDSLQELPSSEDF